MPTNNSVPQIFDRSLLRQRLLRARHKGYANFLLRQVDNDLRQRIDVTLRPFPRVLDIATPLPLLAQSLASADPARKITRISLISDNHIDPGWTSQVEERETLPVAPESFDLAVSGLALQSYNDLPGLLVQARRVLAPDGLFLACLAGGQTLHELRHALTTAEAEITGGASPRVAPFADLRDLGTLMQRAGFALPVTDIDTLTVRYDNLFALIADLRAMGATNVLVDREKKSLSRKLIMRAAEIYAEHFSDLDGRIRATVDLIWLSGWAPHESQQKPLQPGSAKMRLADVLNPRNYDAES